ncbi:hypothetical protein TSOC_003647 [Tetrabaena socialis]|uniref:Uncharacterized protein n=1 Tax=Tetrabaena socialis TaxID=47790 RepID=A0A2J8AAV4_9CHLO|nr:hypothetical protein TSOC_003647 [Tetrabaena socialis]|eukprot:PNH09650.1 hypothetical protein TSOC_003647 [Tetrabaena socialis]
MQRTGGQGVRGAGADAAAGTYRLYCTVGCHPTCCGEFEVHPDGPEAYLQELLAVLREGQALGKQGGGDVRVRPR